MPRRLITPRQTSNDVWRVSFDLPASPDMLAILRGILYEIESADSWEQCEDTISPAAAAAIVSEMIASLTIER